MMNIKVRISPKSKASKSHLDRKPIPTSSSVSDPRQTSPLPTVIRSARSNDASRAQDRRVNWAAAIWLGLIHLGACAAPWTFSWSGLFWVVFLHWFTGSLGICLCFHRLLTHSGFETPRWVRRTLAIIGSLAGEGGPITWCANHRKHHAYSDVEGDPHSPNDGPWWAHMFWLAFHTDGGDRQAYNRRWVPDLVSDPFMFRLESMFLPLQIAFGAGLTLLGYAVGGPSLAISWLVWGICLRMIVVLHTTWFVNSATHIWGYRNYETRDKSTNLWWVGLLAYGEGWHNNHHAQPRLAQHGHRWWEIDMTYWALRGLKAMSLATHVIDLQTQRSRKIDRE